METTPPLHPFNRRKFIAVLRLAGVLTGDKHDAVRLSLCPALTAAAVLFFCFVTIVRVLPSSKMSTVGGFATLERMRQLHADIEQHRAEIVKQQLVPVTHPRHEILRDHFIHRKARQIIDKSRSLLDMYDDDVYASLKAAAATPSSPGEVAAAAGEFEEQIVALRRYHQDHTVPPHTTQVDEVNVEDGLVDSTASSSSVVRFTASELFGKCMDLQNHYAAYVVFSHLASSREAARLVSGGSGLSATQLRVVANVASFRDFCSNPLTFGFQNVSSKHKLLALAEFREFACGLRDYVVDFSLRIRPLEESVVATLQRDARRHVNDAFGTIAGSSVTSVPLATTVGLAGWHDIKKLVAADTALAALADKEKALFAAVECALAEVVLERLLPSLSGAVKATLAYLDRKATKSLAELEKERIEEDVAFRTAFKKAVAAASHRDDAASATGAATFTPEMMQVAQEAGITVEQAKAAMEAARASATPAANASKFTNVKNFPLDATGNPIPVWLYHLHGLHQQYYCEICAFAFQGERAYVGHFSELRHIQCLERLGIDKPGPQFHLVDKREDAIALYRELTLKQQQTVRKRARGAAHEEIEDIDGVVMTREELEMLHHRHTPSSTSWRQ